MFHRVGATAENGMKDAGLIILNPDIEDFIWKSPPTNNLLEHILAMHKTPKTMNQRTA